MRIPTIGFVSRVVLGLASIWLPCLLSAQLSPHDRYTVDVERRTPLQVITISTGDGQVRITVPEHIVSDERFYGSVDLLPERSGGLPEHYVLLFSGQSAKVRDRHFTWWAPAADADTDVQLVVKDFEGKRVALATIAVDAPSQDAEAKYALYIPKTVQSGTAMEIGGPFDGTGSNISLTLAGTRAELLTQTAHKSVFLVPRGLLGNTDYVLTNNGQANTGTVRCVVLEEKIGATSLRSGARTNYQLVLRGLQGIDQETAVSFRLLTPTLASFEPTSTQKHRFHGPEEPTYFPHDDETIFIQPSWVQKDGTFTIHRVLDGIQPGEIRTLATLLMPASIEDEVALALKMPRQNFRKLPGQEHADLLRQRFGDQAMPLLERLLDHQPEFGEAAEAMLDLDMEAAAPVIFRAISRSPTYNWDFALGRYMKKIETEPNYRFRADLHAAAAQIIEAGPTQTAVDTLMSTGSVADLPLLQRVYNTPDLHNHKVVEAALGRLGYDPALRSIEQKLSVVIGDKLPPPDFLWATQEAAYTRSPRLIPVLCRHLRDRSWNFGDTGADPAHDAAVAIEEIRRANPTVNAQELRCP